MWARNAYYVVKPLIPRELQIQLRRIIVSWRLKKNAHLWPIDEKAALTPEGWDGWPDGKRFAVVLAHDVETEKGQDRCHEVVALEERLGFRSSFNFVPEGYPVSPQLRRDLIKRGFEVAVHGLKHDGKLYRSKKSFYQKAIRINQYLKECGSVGFVSPSMHHNLEWTGALNLEYDISTFDTDPFEPQPDGVATIFPFFVHTNNGHKGFVELPYTLSQDFTLFILMKEKSTDIWKKKLDWIAETGGMALVITHPDYMNFSNNKHRLDEYPGKHYEDFLCYIKSSYEKQYWNSLPREMARFWKEKMIRAGIGKAIALSGGRG